jgi:hypothetical protein
MEFLQRARILLRRDGIFIEYTPTNSKQILIKSTTYVTDTDDGIDVDCLTVQEDEFGVFGSCICEEYTTGFWKTNVAEDGEIPNPEDVLCPICDRVMKPGRVKTRKFSVLMEFSENNEFRIISYQPGSEIKRMTREMGEKISEAIQQAITEKSY